MRKEETYCYDLFSCDRCGADRSICSDTGKKIADPDNYTCVAYATVFALCRRSAIALALITKKYIPHCLPELLSEHCCTATAIWN